MGGYPTHHGVYLPGRAYIHPTHPGYTTIPTIPPLMHAATLWYTRGEARRPWALTWDIPWVGGLYAPFPLSSVNIGMQRARGTLRFPGDKIG